jgi:hypothetical protein
MFKKASALYNDPSIGAVFDNLASMFAPPKASDVYAYTKARAEKAEAERLADLYQHGTGMDETTFDRKAAIARGLPISGGYAGVRSTAETSRMNNAADNDRAIREAVMRDQTERYKVTNGDLRIGQNEVVQVSPERQRAMNLADPMQRGNISAARDETVLPAGGGAPIYGQATPLSQTQLDAREQERLRGQGMITDQMLVDAITGRQTPVRAIGPGGRPIFTTPGAATRMGMEAAPTSPTTVINNGGEDSFVKRVGEKEGDSFLEMATDAGSAKADKATLGALRQSLQRLPGGPAGGVQALASRYGIKLGENVGDLEAAQAILAQLVPKQRVPGSGTTSDRDLELFKQALPQIMNTPGGNEKIMQVTEALVDYRLAQGEIARRALMAPGSEGRLTREQAREELARLPYPLAEFRAPPTSAPPAPGAPSAPAGEIEFVRGPDGKLVRRVAP